MKLNSSMAIIFLPFTQKKDSSGAVPIYCRITIDGKRTQFSTGLKTNLEKWSSEMGKVTGNTPEARNINEDLDTIKGNLRRTYNQLQSIHKYVTCEMVKKAYSGDDQRTKTLMDIFTINNVLLYQKYLKKKTCKHHYQRFEGLKKNIQAFLRKEYNQSDIPLCDIKPFFGEELLNYFFLHQNLDDNTAYKYLKITRQVLGAAVRKEWLAKNPLADIKCLYLPPDRVTLTMNEINLLRNAELPTPASKKQEISFCSPATQASRIRNFTILLQITS